MKRWLVVGLLLTGCMGGGKAETFVKVAEAQAGSMPQRLVLAGEVRSRRRATISSVEAGIVERVGVVEGDHVTAGQPLVWLRSGLLPNQIQQKQAAVQAARAKIQGLQKGIDYSSVKVKDDVQQARQSVLQAELAIDQAQKEVQSAYKDMVRKKQLVAEKSLALVEAESAELKWKINQDQLKQAESKAVAAREALRLSLAGSLNTDVQRTDLAAAQAQLAQAQEDVAGARAQLHEKVLRSPIDGVVINSTVEAGQLLGGGGEGLVSVVDNRSLDIYASLAQDHAGRLAAGMQAELKSDLVPGKSFPLRFQELIPATDPSTNTVRGRFQLLGAPHPRLMHGTPVRISFNLGQLQGTLVPRDALRHNGHNQPFVRLVRQGQLEERAVKTMEMTETHVLVSSESVKPGDQVVTVGGENLPDGTRVTVMKN